MVNTKRRGILGGSFDPVHLGHLLVGQEARAQLGLKEVLFAPAGQPWMKGGREIASKEDRWEMIALATETNPAFIPCRVDLDRPGPTYAVDTLDDLMRTDRSPCDYYFIMGMDAFMELPLWKQPQRLLQLCQIAAVARPDTDKEAAAAAVGSRLPEISGRVVFLSGVSVDVSSTDIRRRRREGQPIKYRVPANVEEYILDRGLYE